MPPLTEPRYEEATAPPKRGFAPGLPTIGCRLGLKGCFFGNESARESISRICSYESIDCPTLGAAFEVLFEAVVVRVALEPPWLIFFAADWKSSIAWPTTLFILYEEPGLFW